MKLWTADSREGVMSGYVFARVIYCGYSDHSWDLDQTHLQSIRRTDLHTDNTKKSSSRC